MTDRVSWGAGAYAGFWRRFAGILIDGLVLSLISGVLLSLFGPAVLRDPLDPQTLQVRPGYFSAVAGWSGVGVVLFVAYETAMLSTLGWTLGKRVVGVEVRGADGGLLSVPRALGRSLGKYVSALPLYLGFLWAAWDGRKQAWHDKFVSSYALKRVALQPVTAAAGQDSSAAPSRRSPWGIPARPPAPPRQPAPSAGAPGSPPDEVAWWESEPQERRPAASPADEEPSILDRIDFDTPIREQHETTGEPDAEPEGPSEPGAAPGEDPNLVAVARAGVSPQSVSWLEQVAAQVDARLDRIGPGWRSAPQADAARACAFGVLLGHLARLYPQMEGDLSRAAEAHPSFDNLPAGSRLQTLREISGDPGRATAWLGPLVGTDDAEAVRRLLE